MWNQPIFRGELWVNPQPVSQSVVLQPFQLFVSSSSSMGADKNWVFSGNVSFLCTHTPIGCYCELNSCLTNATLFSLLWLNWTYRPPKARLFYLSSALGPRIQFHSIFRGMENINNYTQYAHRDRRFLTRDKQKACPVCGCIKLRRFISQVPLSIQLCTA